ncbi:molybdate ABC transporter substrate-binding protein [Herbaspirillum sp. AP02]|uniref:molybdate ABC transporter substrate-binding protein n=1 Tax=unclassified Herbaspirillum TaxID=2624150 RepID=UPI0015D97858|nr:MULTISPECIES: molybdate ABC transporter substrate-binding protein [unclassified Herbaspirillum]MBG7618355.1 molybdate ABC transporter substrate-binding protein [Herbaspirillum sp. AP02]NZD68515.1 molybdate ABC transporter substrate-binding protein [Herbaspirillum sp. AP21]
MLKKNRLKAAIGAAFAATLVFSAGAAQATDLVVSAAASLTNAFKELALSFEQQHPGVKVISNFGASDVLMQQIVRGAPADVFASADQTAMDKAVAEKAVTPATRKNFAANQIVVIVPHDARHQPATLADLTRPDYQRIALGNPASVPFGRYTKGALEQAGLWSQVQAKGVMAENVRTSLDYVARGEVDAGFVFATDAAVMPDKVKVAIRLPSTTPATYPIAVTAGSRQQELAAQFVDYVLSPNGQAVLARYGFLKP